MRLFWLFTLILAITPLHDALAYGCPFQDIISWDTIYEQDINFTVVTPRGNAVVYVGYMEGKRNLEGTYEAQIIRRYVPYPAFWPNFRNNNSERALTLAVYAAKERDKVRVQRRRDSEIVGYSIWRKNKDARTGEAIGTLEESFLLNYDGEMVRSTTGTIIQTPVSEPSKSVSGESVLVGVRISLGDGYQILRLRRDILFTGKAKARRGK